MDVTRRDFLGVTAGAAVAAAQRPATAVEDDPLGVRTDFPACVRPRSSTLRTPA
jgi:hypothetical protein